MLDHPARVLHWARSIGQRFFLQFGLHCATHQIRVILISCVVITSLFYPALSLYASSQPKLSSVFGAFTPPVLFTVQDAQKDLVDLWSGYESLRTHEDAVARAKCGVGSALRVERIFIQSPLVDDDGALNQRILFSTLELERRLEASIRSGDTPCLKRPDGACFVLSPLAFWEYDTDAILRDSNILDTLSNPMNNATVAGIPVSPPMVLAGRGSYDHHVSNSKFDYATFLALTYFFPNSDCLGSSEHAKWVELVKSSAPENAIVDFQIQEPHLIALDLNQVRPRGWSPISTTLYGAYAAFFAYIAWSFRRMDAVHSRLGVTFTALVEIAVSTITSLSVCALVGFRITMVPWELLPIVIVFVGAENMFTLVDAVGRTSVTLSVKQRIAEGLSKAGTSNTLKVVTYNSVLGILAVFSAGSVRQFCSFAIVVLVAHWFLAHTFFMAVLSIDIARLELDELLRIGHDSSVPPSLAMARSEKERESAKQKRSGWEKLLASINSLLKGRATTNISLLMLLAITATLYYATYTNSASNQHLAMKPLGAVTRARMEYPAPSHKTTAEQIWHVLNPSQRPLLHIKAEAPTILTINPEAPGSSQPKEGKAHRGRLSTQTFRFVSWMLKIMVLPIAVTTSALYGLLLYLLKDTERLEAQRHADEDMVTEDEKPLESHISFSTLPRAIASDVELIVSSRDGKVVASVGLHNEIVIWNADQQAYVSVDAADVLLSEPGSSENTPSLTFISVEDTGSLVAVGTSTGVIAVWVLVGTRITPLPVLALEGISCPVTELHFVSQTTPSSLTSEKKLTIPPPTFPVLLATYENGAAARWSIERTPTVSRYTTAREAVVVKAFLLHVIPDGSVIIAFALDDGSLDLIETGDYIPMILNDHCMQPGSVFDPVSRAHACRTELNGGSRLVIAVATERGTVSLWDGLTGDCVSVLEEFQGKVNHLRVSPAPSEACHTCGQPTPESISIAFSVDHVIRIYNLYLNNHSNSTRMCSCSNSHQMRHVPSTRDGAGRRSRSNSNSNSNSTAGSPIIPRARLATAFEMADFPVSAHGVHSRRASEKESSGRRSLEQLTVPFPTDEDGRSNGSLTPLGGQQVSLWQNAVVVRVGEVQCQRGGWDVVSGVGKFVGVRRKPRVQGKGRGGTTTPVSLSSHASHGLTPATLERWELWTFDPALAKTRSSPLVNLAPKSGEGVDLSQVSASSLSSLPSRGSRTPPPPPPPSASSSSDHIARLPFTRVSPLLISSSYALAGFGNTIGIFAFSSSDL